MQVWKVTSGSYLGHPSSKAESDTPWPSLTGISVICLCHETIFQELNSHCGQIFPSPQVGHGTWRCCFPRCLMVQRRQPCHCNVCFNPERSALAVVRGVGGGKPHGWGFIPKHKTWLLCTGGIFFWLFDFLPWQLGWYWSSARVIRCKGLEWHIPDQELSSL